MKGIPRGGYTKELREEAVKLVTEGNVWLSEAARRWSLPPSTMGNWVKAYKAGNLGEGGKTQQPLTEIEMELARTKRAREEARLELEIKAGHKRTRHACGPDRLQRDLEEHFI
ncbi:MAG: transposase [Dehalococcoidia bacterium]|nr:transposase [Dehalococcoidia bacterium]